MFEVEDLGNSFSNSDEVGLYDPVQFDPEQTSVDDEPEGDGLALRDAMRDITYDEGRFELLMY